MPESLQAVLDDRWTERPSSASAEPAAVELAIYDDLAAVERIWLELEQKADCTVFQTFDWLAAWQRHIGDQNNVAPAIVVGRGGNGEALFVLPLAVWPGLVRRLTWLGSDLCDYNAPLLAAGFADRAAAARFSALWDEICKMLQHRPRHRHDVVELTKMPERIGGQVNPMLMLDLALNPSRAHIATLGGSWDQFYRARRSPASRRRDRSKRRGLAQCGEVRLVTPKEPGEVTRTLETLFVQKAKTFARMGVPNIFERPGYREFFFALALNPATSRLVHVSRLDVGCVPAAANLGLIFRDTYYHVLASYDDGELSRYGPGAAHLRDLLSHAINLGCRRFDFTIGDEPYKLAWSDSRSDLYDCIAAATARGWPLAALILARAHLQRTIKRDARLWHSFTRLRSALGSRSVSTRGSEHSSNAGEQTGTSGAGKPK